MPSNGHGMLRRLAIVAAIGLALPTVPAQADTLCGLGSPTPGFKVIRLDLPQGSDYLGIELKSARTSRPVEDGSSWHFARGIIVLDASFEIVAFRIEHSGTSPKTYKVAAEDQVVRQDAPGVDGPFLHSASSLVPHLDPGTYYAVGFGVDGSRSLPNEYWSADVRVQGAQSCAAIASGETFDVSHADAEGGTQVYVPNLGLAEEAAISHETSRQLSVGLIDCGVQFAIERDEEAVVGEAECEAALAGGDTLDLEDEVVPFVAGPGLTTVSFEHAGLAPVVALAGASFDLTA